MFLAVWVFARRNSIHQVGIHGLNHAAIRAAIGRVTLAVEGDQATIGQNFGGKILRLPVGSGRIPGGADRNNWR